MNRISSRGDGHRFQGLVGLEAGTLSLQYGGDVLLHRHAEGHQQEVVTGLDPKFVLNRKGCESVSPDARTPSQHEFRTTNCSSGHIRSLRRDHRWAAQLRGRAAIA